MRVTNKEGTRCVVIIEPHVHASIIPHEHICKCAEVCSTYARVVHTQRTYEVYIDGDVECESSVYVDVSSVYDDVSSDSTGTTNMCREQRYSSRFNHHCS